MKAMFFLMLVCVFFLVSPVFSATTSLMDLRVKEQEILDGLLGSAYDKRVRPSPGKDAESINKPVVDEINFFVRQIEFVDTEKMTMKVQLTFRQQWNDSRLAFSPDYKDHGITPDPKIGSDVRISFLQLDDPSRLWKPDIFFSNEISGHQHTFMSPNSLIRIYPNGQILYSVRVSVLLTCPMDLKYYPMDAQTCTIKMASYGYTTDNLIFKWKPASAIQVTSNLHLKDFTLTSYDKDYATSRTNTGEYSAIVARFVFKREFGAYLKDVYIPVLFFLILSYIGLWLKKTDQRLLMTLAANIVMAIFVSRISENFPKTSYTKSVDIYTGVSLTFAFLNLLVVVLSSYLPDDEEDKNRSPEDGAEEPLVEKKSRIEASRHALTHMTKSRFEFFARIGMPILFAVFIFSNLVSRLLLIPESAGIPYGNRS